MERKQPKAKPFVYPYHFDIIGKSSIPDSDIKPAYVEYRRQWEAYPREKTVPDFPLHLSIETTGRCNLMCRHCYRFSRRSSTGDMDFGLFKRIINEGRGHGLYAANLCWMGEPLLHPKIIDMLKFAKQAGIIDVILNTNATLLDKKMCETILDSGSLDKIVFSLDAITEETYNRVKFGSDFKLVHGNIERFIEMKEEKGLRKPTAIVQMIDQKPTHSELMSFIYYWRTRADKIRIATYQSPDGKPNDQRRGQNIPDAIFPCPQLWQRLAVSWDGTVYPCVGDNACREPLGNVKEKSIHEIWNGKRMKQLREMHTAFKADDVEMCAHCDLNKIPRIIDDYGKEKTEEAD